MFTQTETTTPLSMIHTSDFMVVLCNQLQTCPAVKKLKDKNNLTLFNVLTPNSVVMIDNEITANPYILSEAMSLLEMSSQIGTFYSYDFVGSVLKTIVESRYVPDSAAKDACTQEELMQDYFINSTEDMHYFIRNNPVYLGIYIYVYLVTLCLEQT